MLKIVLTILVVVVVGIAALAAYAAVSKPDAFRIERSILIDAPPEAIHPLIDDFKAWTAWSPFEKTDPDIQRVYGPSTVGKGATYSYDSKKVGAGRMEIVDSQPDRIVVDLKFTKPFEANTTATYTLVPEGGATRVTWSMDGKANLMSKMMDTLFSMDKMLGKEFEKGLADLKTVAEK